MRRKSLTKTDLVSHMALSKAWATKLFRPASEGGLKDLRDDQLAKLEAFLGERIAPVAESGEKISQSALMLSQIAETRPELENVLSALVALATDGPQIPGWIETKDMTRIGQEIIRIAFANEDKPGKVTREVLALLSKK